VPSAAESCARAKLRIIRNLWTTSPCAACCLLKRRILNSLCVSKKLRATVPQPSLRPVVPAYPTCYLHPTFAPMPRAHVYSDERRGALLTSPATILSLPPAAQPANYRFITPFFSASSESLFHQLLCFQNYLRCPLVFVNPLCANTRGMALRLPSRLCVPAKSFIYRFCADFAANPFIYRIYANTPGVAYPSGVAGLPTDLQAFFRPRAVSFPLPQYPEPIAPTASPRHHCPDAPNRSFVRCPSP